MLHLAECDRVKRGVWDPIFKIIEGVDKRYSASPRLLITGAVDDESTIRTEHWDLIRITWRCVYAEIQRVRLEGVALDLGRAYRRTVRLFYGRVVAYAEKWRLWVIRNWHTSKPNTIPPKHRRKTYMEHNMEGDYWIHQTLKDARTSITRANRNGRGP